VTAFGEGVKKMRQDARLGLRELARRVPTDPGYLSKIERGTQVPSPDTALAIDRALRADGRLVALLPPPDRTALAVRESERLSRLIAEAPGQRGDDLIADAEGLAVAYLSSPPGPMLDEASAARRDALAALRKTTRPAALADITLAVGELSGVLAYAALDLGEPAQALVHAQAAFDAADAAAAGELKAWVRGTQSLIARFAGDYAAALRFALDGLRYARDGSARVRLLCGVAQCHANMGDAAAARAALDAATDAREDVDGPDGPGLFGFSEAKQAYYSGSSLIWLSDREDAERALAEATRAVELWETSADAERSLDDEALAHVYAATASLQLHDLEQAAAWLEPILGLPEEQRISWIRKRMARVAVLLSEKPYEGDPLAVELRERIADYR
jgi:transcriptional regulator with XRE-family HTH domain